MLPDLFDEDSVPDTGAPMPRGCSCASRLDLPPLPRPESNLVGLENQYYPFGLT